MVSDTDANVDADADRRRKKRKIAKKMKAFRNEQGESRLTVLSDQANEEYIKKKELASVLNRSMDEHWNYLRKIPFRIMGLDKSLVKNAENQFYLGVFMFMVSCLYFIIFGIVG